MTNVKTKSHIAQQGFIPGTSRAPRSIRTLATQMAKELSEAERARREQIGQRIKELRGGIPQPRIAEQVGVTLRAYQAWEAGDSGPAWDNLVALADLHQVTPEYIEYGAAGRPRPETDLGQIKIQLDRIEDKLDTVLSLLGAEAGLDEVLEQAADQRDDPPQRPAAKPSRTSAKRKAS